MRNLTVHRAPSSVLATIAFVGVALTAACVASPKDIKPQHVSEVQYQDWTCKRLSAERKRVVADLTTASAKQEETRSEDTAGIFFLALPLGTMTEEDLAPRIARLKGERDALDRSAKLSDCVIVPAKFEPGQAAMGDQDPSLKQPSCRDVGGYEAYMKKAGKVCRLY